MSVKAMSLVWDLKCPQTINGIEFKPNHKFVLMAYADHADHHGKSIWPSVKTISEKTGLDERTVQRMTRDMETMGLLIDDGQGPRGTNRWKLPFSERGDSLTPIERGDTVTGDKSENSLGDNSLGDNSLGDSVSYEFKEPEPNIFNISTKQLSIWGDAKNELQDEMPPASFETWVKDSFAVHFENNVLWIATRNDYARDWMTNRLTARAKQITGLYVRFLTIHEETEVVTSD